MSAEVGKSAPSLVYKLRDQASMFLLVWITAMQYVGGISISLTLYIHSGSQFITG